MNEATHAGLSLPTRRRRWRTILISLATAWCVFWWGFAAGMQNANQAELRSLKTRLLLWEGVERENPDVAQHANGVAALERHRLDELAELVNSSVLYDVFAPILLPYTVYELRALEKSLH